MEFNHGLLLLLLEVLLLLLEMYFPIHVPHTWVSCMGSLLYCRCVRNCTGYTVASAASEGTQVVYLHYPYLFLCKGISSQLDPPHDDNGSNCCGGAVTWPLSCDAINRRGIPIHYILSLLMLVHY